MNKNNRDQAVQWMAEHYYWNALQDLEENLIELAGLGIHGARNISDIVEDAMKLRETWGDEP